MKKFNNWRTFSTFSVLLVIAVFAYFTNGFEFKNETNTLPKYSQVRIFSKNETDVRKIESAGLFIDHAITKPGLYSETTLSEQEIQLLKNSGVPYEILIDDMQVYYDNLPKMTEAEQKKQMQESNPDISITHSIYGTMGGYMTFDTVVSRLDQMRAEYPNYVSQKFSIGTTFEGRTMWAVRITNGPNSPTGRPEVMYHALIHAREPESMETQFYYFYWLLENATTDPIARYILNNREIYWVPVYNADGYVYNQTTNPNGGGMWRTNRHNTGSGCGYTDVNRNYGTYQYWNSSNGGSSTDPCNGGQGTYRGPSPFSEIEGQNMMNFVNSRHFNASFGAHTYGNYLIKPWAWSDPAVTPDDNKFSQFLADMKASNPVYTTGTPSQTVGYFVRGGSDDWYYNDSTHAGHHIFGITPETGTAFWPAQNQIIPLAQGMFFNNQYMSLIAGPYVNPLSKAFNQATYTPGAAGNYKIVFLNKGVMDAANVHVFFTSTNSNINIPVTQYTRASLPSFVKDSATFNFTVGASAPNNCAITCNLVIKLDTTTIYTTAAYVLVGSGTVVLSDNAESGIGNWTVSGGWALNTAQSHSPTHSFAYAPYPANADGSLTLTVPLNLSASPVCILSYWQRYDVENTFDFVSVEASSDNGTTWQPISSWTGTNLTWTQQSFDITNFTNGSTQAKVRFRLTSDASVQNQGYWVDDIQFTSYCGSLVGIHNSGNGTPKVFALGQNYPNPFNPSTNIKFQLPKQAFVSIKVYDLLGRLVTTLVNENKDAGFYDVNFDASKLASGLYIYKIEAGEYTDTKKMMLIK